MFTKLINWSKENYHDLPWRTNRSLYTTLVSEIMLQQTTVTTVLNHFDRFLKEYPTIFDLAKTTEEQVCISWKGLGYYRRARNLRNAAIQIVEEYKGEIPLDFEELKKIKGIGDYTASALISIGADQRALAIDANIERVVSRILGIKSKKGPKLHKLINERFNNNELVLKKNESYRELNEALMDIGRTFCQARKVSCELCPVKKSCKAFRSGDVMSYPEKPVNKVKKYHELSLLRVIVRRGSKILGYEKSEDKWLAGQVELPTFVISSEDKSLKQYPKLTRKISVENLKKYKTSITKYRITNYVLTLSSKEFKEKFKNTSFKYFESDEKLVNLSTSTIKALKYSE